MQICPVCVCSADARVEYEFSQVGSRCFDIQLEMVNSFWGLEENVPAELPGTRCGATNENK
jgi:hypothetical protein